MQKLQRGKRKSNRSIVSMCHGNGLSLYELESERNQTWMNRSKIGWKQVFNKEGILPAKKERFKIRLVVKGFTQVKGMFYNENFLLVQKHCSMRFQCHMLKKMKYRIQEIKPLMLCNYR